MTSEISISKIISFKNAENPAMGQFLKFGYSFSRDCNGTVIPQCIYCFHCCQNQQFVLVSVNQCSFPVFILVK